MRRGAYLLIGMILLWLATSARTEPELKFKTEIKQDETLKLDWVWHMKIQGPHLFVTVHRDSDVIWYERDTKSGDLKRILTIDLDRDLGKTRHSNPYVVLSEKNILYVSGDWTHARDSGTVYVADTWKTKSFLIYSARPEKR